MRIETSAPAESQQSKQKEKKPSKKIKVKHVIWIIVLLIVLGFPALLLGASGIFHIPVISDVFGASKPVNLGVQPSEKAFQSIMEKFPVEFKGDPNTFSGIGNKEVKGKINVDAQYTSEEITSILDHFLQNAPHIKNTQVKYVEGGMEISTFVKTYLNAPVYAKVEVTKTSKKSVDINVQKIKVGILPVPEKYYDRIEKAAEDILNNRFAKLESFSMDKLEYHNGYSYLKGTVPGSIQMLPGEQELY
ncbi:MAG: hypothetical protein WC693_00300 [Patescibacteria group bacterium]|jgi:hypothetical protein